MSRPSRERLVDLRRELHRRPEPAWREFWTTARIVEELETIGVDGIHLGPDALAGERTGVPDGAERRRWRDRAREAGVPEDLLATMEGGYTGCVAVLERGPGPTVGLRVDIDGLSRVESDDDDHAPAREGFRSETGETMHACGHDAHATLGLGVLETLADDESFSGTLKVFFQPAEESISGAKPMARSGHLDDVDALLAVHVGLDHPTGEVVAGVEGFLAVSQFRADFSGEPAHAGGHPNRGRNAVGAMATAVQNLHAIPRHEDGATRVNAGRVEGGTARNIVPESATIEGEVRGETTALREYVSDHATRVLEGAARTHDCDVELTTVGEAPGGHSDDAVVDAVEAVAGRTEGVDSVVRSDDLGGSEDATYLMERVRETGGVAAYVVVGTDHPGGHHTSTFDVDEASLPLGVELLAEALGELARQR